MKYKNIIFDYGNTIAAFEPRDIIKKFGIKDEQKITLLCDKAFDRKYWDKLDIGTLSQEDFIKNVKAELPHALHNVAEQICNGWINRLPYIDGIEKLIERLKNDGFKLYILSNISKHFSQNRKETGIFKMFDGLVFSAEISMVKPDRNIFEYILNKYSLVPEETVFIDDNADNINAANRLNIKAYLFDGNADKAEAFIYGLL